MLTQQIPITSAPTRTRSAPVAAPRAETDATHAAVRPRRAESLAAPLTLAAVIAGTLATAIATALTGALGG
jgi:hypothetical protein